MRETAMYLGLWKSCSEYLFVLIDADNKAYLELCSFHFAIFQFIVLYRVRSY